MTITDLPITTEQLISAAAYLDSSPYRNDDLVYFTTAGLMYIQPAESEAALCVIDAEGTLAHIE